ncbi:MAG: hypothetical protein AAGI69_22200 [Cyanobacteria bacterium P01_H01_bin.21]
MTTKMAVKGHYERNLADIEPLNPLERGMDFLSLEVDEICHFDLSIYKGDHY